MYFDDLSMQVYKIQTDFNSIEINLHTAHGPFTAGPIYPYQTALANVM